jgi:hypothetical protein
VFKATYLHTINSKHYNIHFQASFSPYNYDFVVNQTTINPPPNSFYLNFKEVMAVVLVENILIVSIFSENQSQCVRNTALQTTTSTANSKPLMKIAMSKVTEGMQIIGILQI